MALTTQERVAIWQRFQELGHCPGSISKTQLRAAIDDIDDFLDANGTSINNAFPQPFRGDATVAQKAFVVAIVAAKRAGVVV